MTATHYNGIVALVVCIAALPALLYGVYLIVLTLASFRRLPRNEPQGELPRFAFVVPAHNESAGISATVESLLDVDYPADKRALYVIADNCKDDTADKARAAGANVLERFSEKERGKGYALSYAFDHLQSATPRPDVVVVIDADTLISPNLLRAFAAVFGRGAEAAQADYAVSNPNASWRTRLMRIALAMFHILRSRGREALRVSCGLRGNGMAFSLDLLKRVPHAAYSIVEDLEYGVALGRAGVRVHYVHDAHVYGEMVAGEKASRSQRERWEKGRQTIADRVARPLAYEAFFKRNAMLFDLAMDVLVPPLSRVALLTVWGLAVAALALSFTPVSVWVALPALLSLVCLLFYVFRGWMLSETGLKGVRDLAFSPVYVAWKLLLPILSRSKGSPKTGSDEWVRTARKDEKV